MEQQILHWKGVPGRRSTRWWRCHTAVRFVTFNFDSIIERELREAIRAIYPASEEDCRSAYKARPITHVHGRLPPIDNDGITPEWVAKAAKSVRVVHDEIDPKVTEAAQESLRSARIVCFLGFSYHSQNLKRLDVQRLVRSDNRPRCFGSAYGLSHADREKLTRYFQHGLDSIDLAFEMEDCYHTLRHLHVMRDEL